MRCSICGSKMTPLFTSYICDKCEQNNGSVMINGIKFSQQTESVMVETNDEYHALWNKRTISIILRNLKDIIKSNDNDYDIDLGGIYIQYSKQMKLLYIKNSNGYNACTIVFDYCNISKIIDFLNSAYIGV